MHRRFRLATIVGTSAGVALLAYAAVVAAAWRRYGRPGRPAATEDDPLLDRFMPAYDIVERHHVHVRAPAALALAAAKDLKLFQQPLIRAIFKGRELLLGAKADERPRPRGILDESRSLGWVVLEDVPDREVVVGAVTRPWESKPAFRSIAPDAFAAFAEPDYVKIAWSLRADPVTESDSIFRTETRALATDQQARRKFRRYFSMVSPGIALIRWLTLGPVKAAAERRARDRSGLEDGEHVRW